MISPDTRNQRSSDVLGAYAIEANSYSADRLNYVEQRIASAYKFNTVADFYFSQNCTAGFTEPILRAAFGKNPKTSPERICQLTDKKTDIQPVVHFEQARNSLLYDITHNSIETTVQNGLSCQDLEQLFTFLTNGVVEIEQNGIPEFRSLNIRSPYLILDGDTKSNFRIVPKHRKSTGTFTFTLLPFSQKRSDVTSFNLLGSGKPTVISYVPVISPDSDNPDGKEVVVCRPSQDFGEKSVIATQTSLRFLTSYGLTLDRKEGFNPKFPTLELVRTPQLIDTINRETHLESARNGFHFVPKYQPCRKIEEIESIAVEYGKTESEITDALVLRELIYNPALHIRLENSSEIPMYFAALMLSDHRDEEILDIVKNAFNYTPATNVVANLLKNRNNPNITAEIEEKIDSKLQEVVFGISKMPDIRCQGDFVKLSELMRFQWVDFVKSGKEPGILEIIKQKITYEYTIKSLLKKHIPTQHQLVERAIETQINSTLVALEKFHSKKFSTDNTIYLGYDDSFDDNPPIDQNDCPEITAQDMITTLVSAGLGTQTLLNKAKLETLQAFYDAYLKDQAMQSINANTVAPSRQLPDNTYKPQTTVVDPALTSMLTTQTATPLDTASRKQLENVTSQINFKEGKIILLPEDQQVILDIRQDIKDIDDPSELQLRINNIQKSLNKRPGDGTDKTLYERAFLLASQNEHRKRLAELVDANSDQNPTIHEQEIQDRKDYFNDKAGRYAASALMALVLATGGWLVWNAYNNKPPSITGVKSSEGRPTQKELDDIFKGISAVNSITPDEKDTAMHRLRTKPDSIEYNSPYTKVNLLSSDLAEQMGAKSRIYGVFVNDGTKNLIVGYFEATEATTLTGSGWTQTGVSVVNTDRRGLLHQVAIDAFLNANENQEIEQIIAGSQEAASNPQTSSQAVITTVRATENGITIPANNSLSITSVRDVKSEDDFLIALLVPLDTENIVDQENGNKNGNKELINTIVADNFRRVYAQQG